MSPWSSRCTPRALSSTLSRRRSLPILSTRRPCPPHRLSSSPLVSTSRIFESDSGTLQSLASRSALRVFVFCSSTRVLSRKPLLPLTAIEYQASAAVVPDREPDIPIVPQSPPAQFVITQNCLRLIALSLQNIAPVQVGPSSEKSTQMLSTQLCQKVGLDPFAAAKSLNARKNPFQEASTCTGTPIRLNFFKSTKAPVRGSLGQTITTRVFGPIRAGTCSGLQYQRKVMPQQWQHLQQHGWQFAGRRIYICVIPFYTPRFLQA